MGTLSVVLGEWDVTSVFSNWLFSMVIAFISLSLSLSRSCLCLFLIQLCTGDGEELERIQKR